MQHNKTMESLFGITTRNGNNTAKNLLNAMITTVGMDTQIEISWDKDTILQSMCSEVPSTSRSNPTTIRANVRGM